MTAADLLREHADCCGADRWAALRHEARSERYLADAYARDHLHIEARQHLLRARRLERQASRAARTRSVVRRRPGEPAGDPAAFLRGSLPAGLGGRAG